MTKSLTVSVFESIKISRIPSKERTSLSRISGNRSKLRHRRRRQSVTCADETEDGAMRKSRKQPTHAAPQSFGAPEDSGGNVGDEEHKRSSFAGPFITLAQWSRADSITTEYRSAALRDLKRENASQATSKATPAAAPTGTKRRPRP